MLGKWSTSFRIFLESLTLSRHYVAFIKKEPGWVLFNDEKVALGGDVDEMKKFAYIYFFRREGK